MFKLCMFVPETHAEEVKRAVFAAGAGQQGAYAHCCWQVLGQGQFRPQAGAQPFIGEPGQTSCVAEYRVELLVPDDRVRAVIGALRAAHPYEEPAFDLIQLTDPAAFE